MSNQTDITPELAAVVALHQALVAADDGIAAANRAVAELVQRRAALDTRASQLQWERPVVPAGLDDQLVAALAVDPTAELPDHVVADAVQQRAASPEALRSWEAKLAIVEQAKPTIDAQIAKAKAAVDVRKKDRHSAWRDFVIGAQSYLVDRLRAEIAPICADIMAPIAAFSAAIDYDPLNPSRQFGTERTIVRNTNPTISSGTMIAISEYRNRGRGLEPYEDVLFSALEAGRIANRARHDADIGRFRAMLTALGGR